MADKSVFTPDEWSQILASPILAGLAVTHADPSSMSDMLKEGCVNSGAIEDACSEEAVGTLANAVAQELETSEGRAGARAYIQICMTAAEPSELRVQALAALKQVSSIVGAKAAEDAASFRSWLECVAAEAANAANEGGFFGIGGVRVSEAERATLVELGQVLSQ